VLTAINAERVAGSTSAACATTFRGAGGDPADVHWGCRGYRAKSAIAAQSSRRRPCLARSIPLPLERSAASRGHRRVGQFHGSTGAGQRFEESILGAHGDKPFADIMKATDWLVAQGLVDSTRMAAGGGSYGGYLTDWILGHTNRFKALVTHAGVYDLMAQFASDATWGRSLNYGAAPWEDPARIDQWSPNRFADRFATPTLILPAKDFRVPVTVGTSSTVSSPPAKPARIVVFPEENH
jgi:hypothetical protein